jgi:hypothetical protein
MTDSFRKYIVYGFGELMLVVVGILIALQIDNWNEDRKERAMLQSYLESIARNMQEDLNELKPLREHRLQARHMAARFIHLTRKDKFDIDEIFFLNQVMLLSTSEYFFSSNTSGFEALKGSGVLDRLQGSSIEHLLSAYYDKVNQISLLESSLYSAVRSISFELKREQIRGLENYAINNPQALPPERFQELQPQFGQLINSPMMGALADSQASNHLLMLHYDSLKQLGQAFIHEVERGRLDASEVLPHTSLDNWNANLGLPTIVDNGDPALEAYWLDSTTPIGTTVFRFDSVRMADGELQISYPGGAEWAAVYWSPMNLTTGRNSADFTRFTRLNLELKGEQGGETITVHVKDADYPDDRAPIGVDLTLFEDWQTYEIDLDKFAPSDFSKLHIALGFLIYPAENPLAFSVRNARYE